jgi:hypothetical protein
MKGVVVASQSVPVCPLGNYANIVTGGCTLCKTGTYQSTWATVWSNSCLSCPAGYSCPGAGMSTVLFNVCPASKYCPAGTITPLECPFASYCPAGASAPTNCTNKPTAVSYIGSGGSTNACPYAGPPSCPAGTFAHATSQNCLVCAAGTYQPTAVTYWAPYMFNGVCGSNWIYTGQMSDVQAVYGGTGKLYWYMHQWIQSNQVGSATGSCSSNSLGYYDETGSNGPVSMLQATVIYNCPPCPAGSFCSSTGMSASIICPAGSYCPSGSNASARCPAGKWVEQTGASVCSNSCPAGTWGTATASTSQLSACPNSCPAGTWGTTTGMTTQDSACPNSCPGGTWGNTTGKTTPEAACANACAAGSWGVTTGATSLDTACNQSCPAGTWGIATGSTSLSSACPYSCPAGTWGATTGSGSQALACSNSCGVGTYSAGTGATSNNSCSKCWAGSYSGTGASTCIACVAGTSFAPSTGSSICSRCTPCSPGTPSMICAYIKVRIFVQ